MLAIVVYTIGSWEGFHRRPMLQALAENLRGRGFLLVVEPPLSLLDSRHLRDWRPAARAVVRPTEQVAENIVLVRPMTTRREVGTKAAYARAIRAALRGCAPQANRVAALIFRPDQAWLLGAAQEQSVIYECYDEYRVDVFGSEISGVREAEDRLMTLARAVLTTSRPLYETRLPGYDHVHYTPNGVDYDAFRRASDLDQPVAEALRTLPAPVIGYVGNFTHFLDFAALEEVACQLPSMSLAFVGTVSAQESAERLGALPNVCFTGVQPRSALPAYLKGMRATICLLNMTAYTRCARPLTVMEYLAAGKPTVLKSSPSVDDLSDLLYFANTADEAVAQIHRALEEDSPELVAARQARAREYDWDVLTKRTAEIILDSCA